MKRLLLAACAALALTACNGQPLPASTAAQAVSAASQAAAFATAAADAEAYRAAIARNRDALPHDTQAALAELEPAYRDLLADAAQYTGGHPLPTTADLDRIAGNAEALWRQSQQLVIPWVRSFDPDGQRAVSRARATHARIAAAYQAARSELDAHPTAQLVSQLVDLAALLVRAGVIHL